VECVSDRPRVMNSLAHGSSKVPAIPRYRPLHKTLCYDTSEGRTPRVVRSRSGQVVVTKECLQHQLTQSTAMKRLGVIQWNRRAFYTYCSFRAVRPAPKHSHFMYNEGSLCNPMECARFLKAFLASFHVYTCTVTILPYRQNKAWPT
jgi:hypothetical protein